MIKRRIKDRVKQALGYQAAVAIIGPRQVGKTTLALEIGDEVDAIYLDLEDRGDRDKLSDPRLFLERYEDRLVILDEIHRVPELFQELRGIIDRGRRKGKRTGRFLVLGSASIDLLRQSGESLAGRIAYVDMGPLDILELPADADDLNTNDGPFDDFSVHLAFVFFRSANSVRQDRNRLHTVSIARNRCRVRTDWVGPLFVAAEFVVRQLPNFHGVPFL